LAAILLFGRRMWPGIALGAFIANVTTDETIATAAGIALGNTLEALVGATLLRRVGFRESLERVQDVTSFVILAAFLSTSVSATIGVTSLCLGGIHPWSSFSSLWSLWWLGDASGALVFAPLILAAARGTQRPWEAGRIAEAVVLTVGMISVGHVIFSGRPPASHFSHPLVYTMFPFVIWTALRFGQRGVTVMIFLASVLAIWRTVHGAGPFAMDSILASLEQLQIFMAVAAVTGLLLAATFTERRRAEEALQEADRRKDDFLAMLGHELRNPLAPIRNAVEILRSQEATDEWSRRARDMIDRQVSHMARLIDDLLDSSRIAQGKIHLRMERCDLTEIVRDLSEDYMIQMREKGLTFAVELPEKPIWVRGDPTRLAQVIGNLLHNASKFTESGGSVRVRVAEDADQGSALVIVRDSGIGMAGETLARVFGAFNQEDRTIVRSQGGLGLGLSLAKDLIELHQGEVSAQSEGSGRGSEFTIRLPLGRALAPTPSTIPIPAVNPSCRVLVVEDNSDAAMSLEKLLTLAGYRTEVASSGPAGIDAAERFRPDVVLCDIGLPGMDGYAVARAMRERSELAGAWLVAITGYAQEEDEQRAAEAGFDVHLRKPVEMEKLRLALARRKLGERSAPSAERGRGD
jgi:signal transduction histidine kinase/ActR/RegA family two-component response regulator